MKLSQTLTRLRTGLTNPSEWEKDTGFRHALDELVRRGLLTAGVLAVLAVGLYLLVNVLILGKDAVLYYPSPSGVKAYVVLWDKLLVASIGILLILMYRNGVKASLGRWTGVGVVVIVSAASVFDDVQGGDVSFAPVYPTIFMLVAVGTLMLRPLQTLGMSALVSFVVLLGEPFFALPGVPASAVVPEQIPFLFIVSVVLTGISLLLYVTRHEQHTALAKAERLERQIAAYAGKLEEKARALEEEKSRTEEHAHALEEEQVRTADQARRLAEAERLKDRFFANVSHEFRTPLTLILGPVRDALDGEYGNLPGQLEGQLSIMRSSGERLLRLVNDLLDLSKLDAGAVRLKTRLLDIVGFLQTVVRTFGDLARRRGINLTFESDLDAMEVSFDPDAIEKVVYNLVSNALKFTPDGGSVRISLHAKRQGDEDFVCISVRDTGPGISPEEKDNIFDRFHQSDSVHAHTVEGTGLGLALVRELMRLHGGEATVESEVGFGSQFTICWPVGHRISQPVLPAERTIDDIELEASGEDHAPHSEEQDLAPANAPLILVVDNDADVRGYIRGRLESAYRVAEASDGVEAFQYVAQERPALIVCDVMMPRMDGIEFCKRIRRDPELADIPVVLLTARADEESRLEGLHAGADDYMAKPFSSSELTARVENLIEIRRLLRVRATQGVVEPTPIDVPSIDQVFLDQVKSIVEEHIGDSNFGVDWLADEVALSTRQLQRRMKKLTRLSAAGYIRLMRLKRASQLLEGRAGNVAQVASAVGFRDAAHFSKLFRQTFGKLPSEVVDADDSGLFQTDE